MPQTKENRTSAEPQGSKAPRSRDEVRREMEEARIRYYAATRETIRQKRRAYDAALLRELEASDEGEGVADDHDRQGRDRRDRSD